MCEKDIDQALRSTFPHCLASSKEFVHLIDAQDDWQEGEETLAMEFKAVNSEEDPGLDNEQVIALSCHLERVETEHLINTIGHSLQVPTLRHHQLQAWSSCGRRHDVVFGKSVKVTLAGVVQTRCGSKHLPNQLC